MENSELLLSIIIPNYNNAKYLNRCINSIIISKSDNFEVIVVDDGSNDDSLEVLNKIDDKRVKVFQKKNGGVSSARNMGIENSNGQYIVFCDADDYYKEDGIDSILSYLTEKKPLNSIIFFDVLIKKRNKKKKDVILPWIDDGKYVIEASNQKDQFIKILCKTSRLNSPFNKIFCSDIIKKYNVRFPQGIKSGEDGVFNLYYAQHIEHAYFLNNYIYVYCYMESDVNSGILINGSNKLTEWVAFIGLIEKFIQDDSKKNNIDKDELLILLDNHKIELYFGCLKSLIKSKEFKINSDTSNLISSWIKHIKIKDMENSKLKIKFLILKLLCRKGKV